MAKRKRNIVIRFRVTPEEREMIESKMAQFGTTNMAAYLRKISIDGYVVRLDLMRWFRCFGGRATISIRLRNVSTRRAGFTTRILTA